MITDEGPKSSRKSEVILYAVKPNPPGPPSLRGNEEQIILPSPLSGEGLGDEGVFSPNGASANSQGHKPLVATRQLV